MTKKPDEDLEEFLREYVRDIVNEFTGAGAAAGYTLPLGMKMDPESLTLKGKWPSPRKKKKKR